MGTILFLGSPAHGHVNPTLALVKELTRRGERVIYYNAEAFGAKIAEAGAEFRAYPANSIDGEDIVASQQEANLASLALVLLRATRTLLPFVLSDLRSVQPDLIVFDSMAVWGRMAASIVGAPSAASITHFVFDPATGGARLGDLVRFGAQSLPILPALLAAHTRLARAYGLARVPHDYPLFLMRGDVNIVFTSRELQPDTPVLDGTFRFVGPSIETPPARKPSGAPSTIYISLGTLLSGDAGFYRRCFEAFGDLAHKVILAAPHIDPAELGPAPANFQLMRWAPQLEVLRDAAAFVTHGGLNSIHEALVFGVPMVVAPHQFEQAINAQRVADLGAGLCLRERLSGRAITAEQLRAALDAVLQRPSYRRNAERLGARLRVLCGYRNAADELQALMARARSKGFHRRARARA